MEPLDIDAIIKKYSSPNWVGNLKTNEAFGDGNVHKEGAYLSSYQSWGQNSAQEGNKFDGNSYTLREESTNQHAYNEAPYWQKFSNYAKLSTNPHNSQIFQNDYNNNKPQIEHNYETHHQYFVAERSNMSQNEQRKECETWKLPTYKASNLYDTHHSPLSMSNPDMINEQNNFNRREFGISNRNFLNEPQKLSTLSESDLMNVFSNEKITHPNLFNGPKLYLNEQVESKPEITINSPINDLQQRKEQNPEKLTAFKHQNEFITKPNSNWRLSSQHTTFNNLPHLQTSQMEDFSPNINQKANSIKEVDRVYKKVESSTTNYTPNSEGFIPLHKTKEQLESDLYDLDDYESRDKEVYNGIEITEKIKTSKLEDFKNTSFCGWKNNVMYDISTKDDNKNKFLLGKWC